MRLAVSWLRENRDVLIVVSLLTLVMTFPTIVYALRTDVFWLPAGHDGDALTEIWDAWYGKLFLSGQADRFFTDRIFYPTGVSLVYHPLNLPYIVAVNALQTIMPVANAFSLAYMLIIVVSTLAAYVYLRWLLADKWIALFGAIVFGFSPHVIGHPNHPNNALIATLPLLVYGFHRGIREERAALVIAAGLLTGATSVINIYAYVCAVFTLGLMACVFAVSRWRSRTYWRLVVFLGIAVALSSLWRVYPMMASAQSLDAALAWRGGGEIRTDLVSFFVNHRNPFAGALASDLLRPTGYWLSETSFLGYLPLLLIAFGLLNRKTRPKMWLWLALGALFLLLRLGSFPRVNGVAFYDIRLPKYYLTELLPSLFRSFYEADNFQIGALLPLAVMSGYGLLALKDWRPQAGRAAFVLLLIAVVATEYYMPLRDWVFPEAQFAFLDWLAADEEAGEIRLINLPMGRLNSKVYNLYQALSGYPHAEGAVSRTPESAFAYIRGNALLNAWHEKRPIHCDVHEPAAYLSALAQLEADGFSHVVFHHPEPSEDYALIKDWREIRASFHGIAPAFSNEYASIYRLSDLRGSCPAELSARHRFTSVYAEALQSPALPANRHGLALVFPPTAEATEHFLRYMRHFAESDIPVATIISDAQGQIRVQTSALPPGESTIDLDQYQALWLVNDPLEFNAELTEAWQTWFSGRYRICRRLSEGADATIDLVLNADIPCAAMDESSALEVEYDSGLRLHNASTAVGADNVRFFLAWTNDTPREYAYSLQFYDEEGNKALQEDKVIPRQLLTAHEIDTSSLPPGAYTVQLIVYDYATRASLGGAAGASAARFERALEIARINV